MHSKTLLSLGLATLTSASPLARRDTSKGFTLIAKVTDPACELDPPVTGWQLNTAHTGAGLNIAVFSDPSAGEGEPGTLARVWYLNGTSSSSDSSQQVLTDGGTPFYPYGISVQSADQAYSPTHPDEHGVSVNVGQSSPVTVEGGKLVNLKGEGTFLACKRVVEYYKAEFVVLEYAYAGEPVPDLCAAITLEPQCAELEDLPADAASNHDFAQDVQCSAA